MISPAEANQARTPAMVIGAIIAVSVAASAFLCWLVYFHAPADKEGEILAFLPSLNAALNFCAAIALVTGFRFIRSQQVAKHKAAMFTAFFFSSVFLACYITNYALHGESHFAGQGAIRWVYFPLLITHILVSVFALPMILITFFLSLSGRFTTHRKVARWTFPLWLYVSVTGVIVHLMFSAYR